MRLLRCSIVLFVGLLGVPGGMLDAWAQGAPTVFIYDSIGGTSKTRAGVWGNGAADRSQSVTYEGNATLEVTTRNFNEGARFDLATPIDLAPYRQAGLLRLFLRFSPAQAAPGMDMGGGMPGMGGPPPGWNPGMGGAPVDMPGAMGGGDPAMMGMPVAAGPQPQQTNITQLQVALVMEKGAMFGRVDVPDLNNASPGQAGPDESGWYLLSLPVREMRATPNAGGLVRRVILTSDKEDTFYLAQMALGTERERMTVSIRRPADPPGTPKTDITVKPGSLTLVADVEAGTANPIIEWNFDADNVGNLPPPTLGQPGMPPGDPGMMGGGGIVPGTGFVFRGPPGGMDPAMGGMPAPAGPRIDARGLTAKIDYPNEEQNYRVEVTVRDRSGQKSPVKASLIVQVRA